MGENRTLACPGHVAKRVRKWGLIIIVYPLPRPEGILQRHFLRKDLHPITHLCWSEEVRRNRYTLPGGKKEGKERKLHVSLVSLATVSTTAMEKTMPFLVQRWLSFASMVLATSMGVCSCLLRRATATNENIASISSCVWPTCRWWHEATPHRPA